jgi:hypothetical protein
MTCAPKVATGLSPGLNGAKIRAFGTILVGKGPLGFSPNPRHRLEASAPKGLEDSAQGFNPGTAVWTSATLPNSGQIGI